MSEKQYGYKVKERNLLLMSYQVQKDYPSFYRFMEKHPKAPILSMAEKESDKELAIILSREDQTLSDIVGVAQKEWGLVVVGYEPVIVDDREKQKECQLCGQTHLRYLYTIENHFNHNQMIIGSDCVEEYCLDNSATSGEAKENFIAQQRDISRMNTATLKMNALTNNAIIRINASCRTWENLPYLPSPETTKGILKQLDLIYPMLDQIRNAKRPHTDKEAQRCEANANLLQNLLGKAAKESYAETTEWRVSNAVYRWAIERDKNNASNKLVPLLLKKCRITSENIAYITEEEHKRESIERLAKVISNGVRLKYAPEQPNRIKVYLTDRNTEYPFWIYYGPLIKCAVRHGFPEAGKLEPFTKSDFLEMEATFDMQDGFAGSRYLEGFIERAGGKKQDENDRGDRYLIRINQKGVIFDTEVVVRYLSSAILTGDTGLIQKILNKHFFTNPTPYSVAKQNWEALYGRGRR